MDSGKTLEARFIVGLVCGLCIWSTYCCVCVAHVVYSVVVHMVMCTCNVCIIVYI